MSTNNLKVSWQLIVGIIGLGIVCGSAIISLYSRVVLVEQKGIDIQNQLCAQDIVRNVMHATDLRLFSMLMEKSFPGAHYDIGNAFYPIVGQCGGASVQK